MATDKQIEACLIDVQEDVLVDKLLDSEELGLLAKAIVHSVIHARNGIVLLDADIRIAFNACVEVAVSAERREAEKLANKPENVPDGWVKALEKAE